MIVDGGKEIIISIVYFVFIIIIFLCYGYEMIRSPHEVFILHEITDTFVSRRGVAR